MKNVSKIAKEILELENIIVKAGRGKSQKGDVSEHLTEQGFFDKTPSGLKQRDENVTGNPVDVLDEFKQQNPD